MKRFVRVPLAGVVLVVLVLTWWLKVDRGSPVAGIERDDGIVGRNAVWEIDISASGRSGLQSVEVRLLSGERTFPLAERQFPAKGWLGSGVGEVRLAVEADLARLGVPEGPAVLEVRAETHGWRLFGRDLSVAGRFAQNVDRTPPRAQVLSEHHNTRLGGTVAAVFRLGDDATGAEVRVGGYRFPVNRDYFADESLGLSLFAIPEDLTADVQPVLHATDAAGNVAEVPILVGIRPREFRERTLEVDDAFLRRKIPPLLTAQGMAVPDDLLQGYLVVNRDVRARSEQRLWEATRQSAARPLWSGAFHRMARSQTMSEFGDRRSYSYASSIVDRQTHLGVDLASLRGAEVGAAQAGEVVFAGDLGIYGDTVVLDHGLHVFSLYGHLSSIAVSVGDALSAGQVLGHTGQSGLAGGDHLHFSVMVHGIHVDPIEWWDPKWMKDRLTAKLELFPTRAEPAQATDDGEEAA